MRRKIWSICLIFLLTLAVVFPVCAAQDHEISREALLEGFVLEDKLYVYFAADKSFDEDAMAMLMIQDKMVDEEKPAPFVESGQYVHYFILLDASGSVSRSKNQIKEFVLKLMEDTKVNHMVTILTLGESFNEVISGSMEDDAVERALDKIAYSDQRTNLYKGLDSAINYMDEKNRSRGDLYRLILVTDGSPDGITEKPRPEDVKRRVEARTDIVFDVIGIGNWNDGSEKNLPMSGREAVTVRNLQQAEDAAEKIALETNSLYTACFGLNPSLLDKPLDIKLWISGIDNNIVLSRNNITIIGKEEIPGEMDAVPEEQEETQETDIETQPEGTSENDETQPEQGQPDIATETESGQEQGTAQSFGTQETRSETEPDDSQGEIAFVQILKNNKLALGGILAGAAVICTAVFTILHKASRNKNRITQNHLRVEVLSGQYVSRKKEFSLEHTLIIGSGRKCDMIWNEPDVAEQNTRIFVHDGMVCIEDLNSPCGTVIGGMRIFAPNRLRSGDIVSIGRVQFRVYFHIK